MNENTWEGRVAQKVATLSEWNAINLKLYKGEQAFVVNSMGQPVNFRIGDGTKAFKDLTDWIKYDQSTFVSIPSSKVLPTPVNNVGYSIVSEGVYTRSGQANIVVSEGNIAIIYYNGTTWVIQDTIPLPKGKEIVDWAARSFDMGDQVFYNNIIYQANSATLATDIPNASVKWVKKTGSTASMALVKSGVEPISQGAVYTEIYGGNKLQFGLNLPEYTANLSTGAVTVVFTEKFEVDTKVMRIKCYAFTAGKVAFKTFNTNGLVATPLTENEITLVSGINNIDVSDLNIIIKSGSQYGYSCNTTTRLGRVGYKSNDQRANYHATSVESNGAFTMNGKASTGGLGFDIEYDFKGIIDGFKVVENKGDLSKKFEPQLGGVIPDYSTENLKLQFTTGNQSVVAKSVVEAGKSLMVRLTGKSSALAFITIGIFSSSPNPPITTRVLFNNEFQTFEFPLESSIGNISLGIVGSNNQLVEISTLEVFEVSTLKTINQDVKSLKTTINTPPQSFFLDTTFFSLSKIDKKRTTIIVEGDSLMANATGGVIPNIEAGTQRPIRLNSTNTISRRMYDYLCWNKPKWRRFDDPSWVKTGAWASSNVEVFEPMYELYHSSNTGGSSAEITVPAGFENFAFICRAGKSSGVIEIYLNDVLYTSVDTLKENAGHTGNPFKTIDVLGMPADKNNIIKIVNKANNSNPVYVWGGYYWSGNTLVVYNTAHGMHTLQQLLEQHLDDEIVDNKPDAIFFQQTLMNDTARITDSGNTLAKSKTALLSIFEKLKGKDLLMTSCQPYGKNPTNLSTNFYVNFPGMEQVKDALKTVAYQNKTSYIDIFDIIKKMTINKGGTLEGGEAGIWLTHDGQHLSEFGTTIFFDLLKPKFKMLPIKD